MQKIFNLILTVIITVYFIDIYSVISLFLDIPLQKNHFLNISLDYIAFFLLILFISRFLPPKWIKIILTVCFIPITIANFFIIGYLIYYHAPLSTQDFQSITDTNIMESWEFVKEYFGYKFFIVLIILIIPYFLIWFLKPIKVKSIILNVIFLIIAGTIIGFTYNKSWVTRQISYVYAYENYRQTVHDKEVFLASIKDWDKHKTDYGMITNHLKKEKKQVFVIVIGESQNRLHYGLYGYKRNTNPKLSAIKNELYIFKNVISPFVYTSAVLQRVLTFSGTNLNNTLISYKNIIDFFKQAGFKTYWLSNQYFLGPYDSGYSAIAYQSDKSVFLNKISGVFLETANYDGALINPFKEALCDKGNKKVIFVHLIGSHTPYERRFPKGFGDFKNSVGDSLSKDNILTGHTKSSDINAYDNSIEYTDNLLGNMIMELKKQNSDSFLLYFSDHGSDVYDTLSNKSFPRGNSDLTKSMTEIPFILWLSKEYKKDYASYVSIFNKDNITNRPYQTHLLINSILDLARLSNKDTDKEYSIFSDKFVPQIRMINGFDYDKTKGPWLNKQPH